MTTQNQPSTGDDLAPTTTDDPQDRIAFIGNWRGLYVFILLYGVLQVLLLYLFTVAFNHA